MSARVRPLFRRAGFALLLGALSAGALPLAASAAPRPITFEVFIGDVCVFGRARNNTFLKVIIRDAQGREKGREAVEADPDGFWMSCTFNGAFPILPTDTINVEDFESGQKRNFTVPLLTAKVDRGPNVVSGKAPARSSVEIEAFDFRFDLWGEQYDVVRKVAAIDGTYTYDFDDAGVNIKGGAQVVVRWRNGSDTVLTGRFQMAPFLIMAIGSSEVVGAIGANRSVRVTLADAAANRLATANGVGSYGVTTFFTEFADSDGEPYLLKGGEWLNAPALGAKSSWRVPAINGTVGLAADTVSGTCFANGKFVVLSESGFESGFAFGTANSTGKFTVDLTEQVDVRRGFRTAILCYSPEGDEISQEFIA